MGDNPVTSVTAAARKLLNESKNVIENEKSVYAGDVKAFKDISEPLRKPGFVPENVPVETESTAPTVPRAAARFSPSKFVQPASSTQFFKPTVLPFCCNVSGSSVLPSRSGYGECCG